MIDLITSAFYKIVMNSQTWVINSINAMEDYDAPPILYGFTATFKLLAKPLSLFPLDFFHTIWRTGIFWLTVLIAWSLVEWIYKKIPGVS